MLGKSQGMYFDLRDNYNDIVHFGKGDFTNYFT